MKFKKAIATISAMAVIIGCLPQANAENLTLQNETAWQSTDFSVSDNMEISGTDTLGNTLYNEQCALENQYKDCACSLSEEMRQKYEEEGTLEARIEFMKTLSRPQGNASTCAYDDGTDMKNATSLADIKNKDSFLYQNCPTTGDVKALVFLVNFADIKNEDSSLTAEEVEKRLEGKSNAYYYESPYTSVSGYYNISSYGKFNIDFDVYGWYNSDNDRSYYENAEISNDLSGNNVLIEEIMEYYDSSIDFSEYDANNDGLIDLVYFMYTGENAGWATQWWSYVTQFPYENTYDNEGISKYCFVSLSGNAITDNVTVIHESGHLLGLADYYNYDSQVSIFNSGSFIGSIDMMSANMGDHNIFSKMLLGWVEPVFVTEDMSFDVLCSTERDTKAYVVAPKFENGVFGEYFIIEYYKGDGANNIDGVYCPEGAVRIYHVDATLFTDGYDYLNSGDTSASRPLIMLMDSSGYDYAPLYGDEIWADQYYSEGMTLGINTMPSTDFFDGVFSGINIGIDKLSENSASISVSFSERDNDAPELRETRIPNVLGKALGISGSQIFFTSNIYEGENLNKISIASKDDPSDKTCLEADVQKYTSSERNCSGSVWISTIYELKPNTDYILNIPSGAVIDSSGNSNEEINIDFTSIGGDTEYSDFDLPDIMILPEGMPDNAEILADGNSLLPLDNGNLVCLQVVGFKTDEENVYENKANVVYKVFSSDRKLICNENIATIDTWTFQYSNMFELENENVLLMLDQKFYVFDGEGKLINTDTYLPHDTEPLDIIAPYFRRGDNIDVVDQATNGKQFVCRIGNDGKIVQRFDITGICENITSDDSIAYVEGVAKCYNDDYTVFNEPKYRQLDYVYSINITKNDRQMKGNSNEPGMTGYNHEFYVNGNNAQFVDNTIFFSGIYGFSGIHDVKETISKISFDKMPMLELAVSDYIGNALPIENCIVLEDDSILMVYPICVYPHAGAFRITNNTFLLRLNNNLEPIWSSVAPFEVTDAALYGESILVMSEEKVYLFDDSSKTSMLTHDEYDVSDEYDYDSQQNLLYTPSGKTAEQLRNAIECENTEITVYDENGKIADEGKTLQKAVVEVKSDNSLYSVFYSFVSDYEYLEWLDGTISITRYIGKNSNIVVPAEIDGKKVEGIIEKAFCCDDSLVSVEIPQGIGLNGGAFEGCPSLVSVKISDGVVFAWGEIFKRCSPNLTIYGYANTQAEAYAEEFNVKFVSLDDSSKIQVNGGIAVAVPEGSKATLENAVLEVKKADADEVSVTFDISLVNEDGKEVQPGGEVEVKIPVPAGFDGENCNVYRVIGNGKYTDMKAKYENGFIVFNTNHFSEYVITTEKLADDIILGDVDNNEKISTVDAKWILQYVSGSRELTPEQLAAADVNHDGRVTTVDAKWILQAVSGSRELE